MKKNEYIEMLLQENNGKNKTLYADVIDCIDIALSQEPDSFEIEDTSLGLEGLFALIEEKAKTDKTNCVGPFEAAEMFAAKFGAKYIRLSRRSCTSGADIVNLEDFL